MANTGKSIDQIAAEFYLHIGICISGWATVEDQLFRIFWTALRCPMRHAAIVFFKSPSIETRLTLTTELVEAAFPNLKPGEHPHPDLDFWRKDILKRFETLKPVRNKIAHHPVIGRTVETGTFNTQMFNSAAFNETTTESWFEVYVSGAQEMRGQSKIDPPLRLEDLRTHQLGTNLLTTTLIAYHGQFAAHIPGPPLPHS